MNRLGAMKHLCKKQLRKAYITNHMSRFSVLYNHLFMHGEPCFWTRAMISIFREMKMDVNRTKLINMNVISISNWYHWWLDHKCSLRYNNASITADHSTFPRQLHFIFHYNTIVNNQAQLPWSAYIAPWATGKASSNLYSKFTCHTSHQAN